MVLGTILRLPTCTGVYTLVSFSIERTLAGSRLGNGLRLCLDTLRSHGGDVKSNWPRVRQPDLQKEIEANIRIPTEVIFAFLKCT